MFINLTGNKQGMLRFDNPGDALLTSHVAKGEKGSKEKRDGRKCGVAENLIEPPWNLCILE